MIVVNLQDIGFCSAFLDYSLHTKTIVVPINMYIQGLVVKNTQVIYMDGAITMANIEHFISHHFSYSWNAMTTVWDWVGFSFSWFSGHHLAFNLKKLTDIKSQTLERLRIVFKARQGAARNKGSRDQNTKEEPLHEAN